MQSSYGQVENLSYVYHSKSFWCEMNQRPSHSVALIALIVALVANVPQQIRADEKKPVVGELVDEFVDELDEKIRINKNRAKTIQGKVLETRKRMTDVDREWQTLTKQLETIQTNREQAEKKIRDQDALLAKAKEKSRKAKVAFEAAAKVAELARIQAEAAEKEAVSIAKAIPQMQAEVKAIQAQLPPLVGTVASAKHSRDKIHGEVDGLESQLNEIAGQRQSYRGEIEKLLREVGEWVSFSQQIAPIFHNKCGSCHNSRNAKGRFSITSYTDILSSGESGGAIEPGNVVDSLLCQLLSDGSMPKDGDPLLEDEIELINRWVEIGARLDAAAEPTAPLLRIMPRVQQPLPPPQYRVAIPVTALAVHPSRQMLASSGYHEILLWSLPNGKLTKRITNVAERVYDLEFHQDGKRLAVASGTPGRLGEVKVFDTQTGALVGDLLVSADAMFSVSFSPDGQQLAAGGADGSIVLFQLSETGTQERIRRQHHADWVNSIAWSPDGQRLISSSRDKTSKVIDSTSGNILSSFASHKHNVKQAAFTEDGKRAISIGADGRLRIWTPGADDDDKLDVKLPSEPIRMILSGQQGVAVASDDGVIRTYDYSSGKLSSERSVASSRIASLAYAAEHQLFYVGDLSGDITSESSTKPELDRSWPAVPDSQIPLVPAVD